MATGSIPDWVRLASVVPAEFRRRLVIDTGDGPTLWGSCCDPWQQADFAALDLGWQRAVGILVDGNAPAYLRAYLERPRGHSKTTDIAAMAAWALFAARTPLRGLVAAGDRDQAKLVRDAIERLVAASPWLRAFLVVRNYEVVNPHTGSKCVILAADAESNYGELPDFLICDELTHWVKPAMWDAMFSAVAKRPNCMVVIISNAGVGQGISWQWKVREVARLSDDWYFSRIDRPEASWITQALLAEQRLMLPGAAYRRLWLNQWTRGQGDALEPADIEAAMTLAGPPSKRYDGWVHIIGLDLGAKLDHSAMVVLAARPGSGRIKLADCQSWRPPGDGGEVSFVAVRQAVLDAARRFDAAVVLYDPHQAILMAQDLRRNGLRCEEVPFVGKHLNEMASAILQVFRSRKIDLYRDADLERDLLRLTIVERPFGFKLEAAHDEYGHADRGIALAIALPIAAEVSELAIVMPATDGFGSNLLQGVPM